MELYAHSADDETAPTKRWQKLAPHLRGVARLARQFAEAARMVGNRPVVVLFKHLVPNSTRPLLSYASISAAWVVGNIAALGYIGLGTSKTHLSRVGRAGIARLRQQAGQDVSPALQNVGARDTALLDYLMGNDR